MKQTLLLEDLGTYLPNSRSRNEGIIMETAQQTMNVQDFAGKLATELKDLARITSSPGCLTGAQIADCASDVLRIDFRCRDIASTLGSLPASVGVFLRHAFDNPKGTTNIIEPIRRLERISQGAT